MHTEYRNTKLVFIMSSENKNRFHLEALKLIDKGETMQQILRDIGVGRDTVGDWKRKRRELEKWSCVRNCENSL